ncbi:DUF6443 domain-containing protein, partial [Ravibacter arvi]|uniref:DUF6443 domain-containing protein n=1 Tax=Ravibacter arvi TaxID=2051041 RepID=UPI0031EB74D0
DGLGRPLQQVSAYTSPVFTGGKPADLITHTEYDAYGRVSKVYLPYPHSGGNAAYQSTAPTAANSYYNSADFTEANSRGYALTEYEASPLNRVTKQYAGGTDKAVEFLYGVNGSNDVKLYTVSGNTLNQSSYYAANQLSYVETKDENQNRTREYKDKQGLVVLRRAYVDKDNNNSNLDTYYVYDDLDRIRFVLQPSYQDNASAERYFYYEYNDRGLLVKKKVPGAGTTELTYNDRDLLYTSLDANKKTTYYKYDALNRLIETGIKAGAVENALTKTFYDTYPAELPTFNNNVAIGYPSTMRSNVTGMQTGTATLVINPDSSLTTNFLYSAVYYNDRLQVIQEVKQLYDLGGFRERSASVLRYDGQLEKKIIYQQTDKGVNSVEKTY